jgi:hypothetical protein
MENEARFTVKIDPAGNLIGRRILLLVGRFCKNKRNQRKVKSN